MRSVAAVVAIAACLHAGIWGLVHRQSAAPEFNQPLPSVSYTPFHGILDPKDSKTWPTAEQVRADLKAIAPLTRTIRLYRSTAGMDIVPPIAAEFGLKVTVGIWLDTNLDEPGKARFGKYIGQYLGNSSYHVDKDGNFDDQNELEIRAAIDMARKNRNVNAIVVGNETTLRRSLFWARIAAEAAKAVDDMRATRQMTPDEVAAENKRTVKAITDNRLAALQQEAENIRASQLKENAAAHVDPVDTIVSRLEARQNVDDLVKIIQRVKRQTSVPVTTGETYDIWQSHPELASAVDFIGAHILPYWDKQPYEKAVDFAIGKYKGLREQFEGKRIVVAEFGWPSGGYNRNGAEPGRLEQATVMRDFATRADALGIDYNVIEAYDQPWKNMEGSVGQYWGLFDTARNQKFAWTGPLGDQDFWALAAIAVAIGFLVSLPVLAMGATVGQATMLAAASHLVGVWASTLFAFWNGQYFVFGSAFALGVGLFLLGPLVLIALARIDEIAAIMFGRGPSRLLQPLAAPDGYAPKVSIHIPAYQEPPEMLKATLDSVAALDYPNFECVVIINNTPDPYYWRPIEEHCRTLGERFKFINATRIEGFKAGALRLALADTAPDAEIIGVIDADYTVEPNWLGDLVPAFADPKVGLVQAPQDHRDEGRSPLHRAMNSEYAGFFDIGMVERNENNAIIVHGTMCLIRRAALDAAGGWSSDTICEDSDLGLTIMELGWDAHYTNRRYGYGLLPDSFEAFKKQRHRWAYGGLQIVRKHWRRFLPGAPGLTSVQRRDFVLGWLNWLGAEAIGVVMAFLNLLWVPVVAFVGIAIPDKVLTLPIIAAFVVSVAHFVTLYHRRVALPASHAAVGMIAAMAMQWTVARAVGFGLIKDHLPFVRTAKGGAAKKGVAFPAFYEAVMGGLLVLGAVTVFVTNYEQVREVNLFALVLLVQSLPFLSAASLAMFETSRFNDFAYLGRLQAAVIGPIRRLKPRTIAPSPAMAEKRIEAAQ